MTFPGLSFGQAAGLYDRIRPGYPVDAVRWMLGPERCRVVDLGAGTGIFTRILTGLGHDVVAVEPDAGMRERLAAASPAVTVLAGAAEVIPLPDGSVDAVVAAQAYHWFSPNGAHREIARVLRPGGVFAPIWNVRDDRVPWVAELTRLVGSTPSTPAEVDFGGGFGPIERYETRHAVPHDTESLVALFTSRSYYLSAAPQERERITAAVRGLAATQPQRFELPYRTVSYRASRYLGE